MGKRLLDVCIQQRGVRIRYQGHDYLFFIKGLVLLLHQPVDDGEYTIVQALFSKRYG